MGQSSKPDVSGVVIEKDGRYLLVQEGNPKVYGKWNLPAGHVDKGETPRQAAVREAKEETGLDVELGQELLVLHVPAEHRNFRVYAAKITSGRLKIPEDELLAAQWFTYEEVVAMKQGLRFYEFAAGAIEKHAKTNA